MNSTELKDRTKKFAVNTIKFTDGIKPTYANVVIIKQVIRSATSVGANYRAALRGKSNPDFVNKINIIQEEADESIYWFELLEETNTQLKGIDELIKEANELTAIFSAILKTLKFKNNKK
ncbi:MAG: four helix bundle protein [Sphingobacteriales bacterium]|nr:four helix bundle protein [Sphingobacteriales bacterium]